MRASVVLMPGLTSMTATVPLPPICWARLSAASAPPATLLVVMWELVGDVGDGERRVGRRRVHEDELHALAGDPRQLEVERGGVSRRDDERVGLADRIRT